MTDQPSLSVVVASHGRPSALRRCLLSLVQCSTAAMEVIVVTDKTGLEVTAGLPFAADLKTVLQAKPNLAEARNDGIAQASGEIVAFIDDDAVAEPTWAHSIASAFAADATLAAATGPVLGRNGISLQWGPMAVDRQGRDSALEDGRTALPRGTVRKLHGTNMAVRREDLLSLGGFDPAFHFYLDDTDLAVRLADANARVEWLAGAQVHHAFDASPRRDSDRIPLDLFDIGASTASFVRKHAPQALDEALSHLAEDQRARLFRLARRRKLGPRDIERLMLSLREGVEDGQRREIGAHSIRPKGLPFRPLPDAAGQPDIALFGWRIALRRLRSEAARLVAEGARVTVTSLEPTPRAHRVRYTDGGWWEQTGGLFGRSNRAEPRFQFWRFEHRVENELDRISETRFINSPSLRFIGA